MKTENFEISHSRNYMKEFSRTIQCINMILMYAEKGRFSKVKFKYQKEWFESVFCRNTHYKY